MKRLSINKGVLVWLLSVVFIFPYIAKSAHLYYECKENICHCHHNSECSLPNDKHHNFPEHDCTNCQICQFTLPYFTKAESFHQLSIIRKLNIIIDSVDQENIYIPVFTTRYLRAPPIC